MGCTQVRTYGGQTTAQTSSRDVPVKVVANAGGVNPQACMEAVLEVMRSHGLEGEKVAIVEGDDILDGIDGLMSSGEEFLNMDTGAPLSSVRERVTSAKLLLGESA